MNKRQQKISTFVKELLNQKGTPRNQIAGLSGLTNTYLKDLEQGKTINIGREKIIHFSIALSLDLFEIDQLLNIFDRTPLSEDDIPIFLSITKHMRLSSAINFNRSYITHNLLLISMRLIPGKTIAILNILPSSFEEKSHYNYIYAGAEWLHPVYSKLYQAVVKEKNLSLTHVLDQGQIVEHYACKNCVNNIIRELDDPKARELRVRQFQKLIHHIKKYDNYHFYLADSCPTVSFVYKQPNDKTKENEKLLIVGKSSYEMDHPHGLLVGLATESPVVIKNFEEELKFTRKRIVEAYTDKEKMVSYLEKLIAI